MSETKGHKKKERLGALGLAVFFTVATAIYLWDWLFDGLDMDNEWVGPFGSLLFGTFCVSSWAIYFVKLPSTVQDRLLPAVKGFGYILGFIWLILGIMMVFMPFFQQVQHWLQYGEIPHRDLYWFLAEPSCEGTNWQARGWEGMDICRDPTMLTTGWIGFDKISAFILDLHTAVIFIGGTILLMLVGAWFLGQLEQER